MVESRRTGTRAKLMQIGRGLVLPLGIVVVATAWFLLVNRLLGDHLRRCGKPWDAGGAWAWLYILPLAWLIGVTYTTVAVYVTRGVWAGDKKKRAWPVLAFLTGAILLSVAYFAALWKGVDPLFYDVNVLMNCGGVDSLW